MSDMSVTEYQLKIMKHAIGFRRDKIKRGKFIVWRNYFASYSDVEDWERLVKQELAVKRGKDEYDSMNYYFVTDKGIKFLSSILDVKIVEEKP